MSEAQIRSIIADQAEIMLLFSMVTEHLYRVADMGRGDDPNELFGHLTNLIEEDPELIQRVNMDLGMSHADFKMHMAHIEKFRYLETKEIDWKALVDDVVANYGQLRNSPDPRREFGNEKKG